MDAYNNIDFTNIIYNEHIMLLYEDKNKRNKAIIEYINEGLKNGYLCIHASIDIDNSKSISLIDSLSSTIINYEANIRNENLQFINFKPYYESALKGDLTLFEKLKLELEYRLYKRLSEGKKDKILIFADAACTLSETRHFKECIDLEKWWQDVNLDWIRYNKEITVICPHPNYVFKEKSLEDIKNKIRNFHDAMIDIEDEQSLQSLYTLITNRRNFDDLGNYEKIIKTMKEIKSNFMEEHKNIINTYYSLYSKRLDDIIYNNLNSLKTVEEYSKTHNNTNKNLMNHTNNTRIIDDIIDKNMNTFIKSIKFTNKFYSDVVQSYYNYIKTVNKFSER